MTKIYYQKIKDNVEGGSPFMMGLEFCKEISLADYENLTKGDLRSHTLVKEFDTDIPLEEVFRQMQGEVWSPNGEAKELITKLGLSHTSMMVGDIVENSAGLWFCDWCGWTKLK